ncbi:MAG: hypothetical protein ACJAQ4_001270 [Cryomorphaceae bacterium]|jgi:hypothetical protein
MNILGLRQTGQMAFNFFDRLSPKLLIFGILALCYFSLVPNANEEQYLALAKQFGDSNWIPQSINLSEFPGTRIIYQSFFGFVLKHIGFGATIGIFRIVLILLILVPIAKIYESLKFTNTEILIHLGVLFIAQQSLFAGSFIFLSVESKCFSYVAVFWAIYFMIKSKQAYMVAFLIVATYLHALVGFWSAFYIFASQILFSSFSWKSFKKPTLSGLAYSAAILPFVFYLMNAIEAIPNQIPTSDWIYTYFRSPHHTALAPDFSYFYQNHFYGILWTAVGVLFVFDIVRRKPEILESKLAKFALVALTGSVVLVCLAFIDREGKFLKYYPYRIMTLATFLLFLILTKRIGGLTHTIGKIRLLFYSLLLSGVMLLEVIIPNLKNNFALTSDTYKDLLAATAYIKENSEKDAIIFSMFEDNKMIRLTERNAFASYKFVPAESTKLHDWYERVLATREIQLNPTALLEFSKEYRIDYVISDEPLPKEIDREAVFQQGDYFIYNLSQPD